MAEKKGSSSEKTLHCSFCGKSQHEVKKLIAGPSVFICDECIDLCNEIIRDELPAGDHAREAPSDLRAPGEPKRARPAETCRPRWRSSRTWTTTSSARRPPSGPCRLPSTTTTNAC